MEADAIRLGARAAAHRTAIVIGLATCAIVLTASPEASGATFTPCDPPMRVFDDGGVGYVVLGFYYVQNLRATPNVPCRKARRVSRSVASRHVVGRCTRGTGNCHYGSWVCRRVGGIYSDKWVCKKGPSRRLRFRIDYQQAPPPPDLPL